MLKLGNYYSLVNLSVGIAKRKNALSYDELKTKSRGQCGSLAKKRVVMKEMQIREGGLRATQCFGISRLTGRKRKMG